MAIKWSTIISVATCLLQIIVLAPPVQSDDLCGLGSGNDYCLWVADDFGRLRFPIFNQDVYGLQPEVDPREVCSSILSEQITAGYENTSNSTCQYDVSGNKWICKGDIDFDVINEDQDLPITSFVVDGYSVNAKIVSPEWHLIRGMNDGPSSPVNVAPGSSYKITAIIFSAEIGIGVRIALDLTKVQIGYVALGDVYSNELRLGWRVNGTLIIINKLISNGYYLQANLNTIDTEGGWTFEGNCVQTCQNCNTWTISGHVSLGFLSKLPFSGNITNDMNLSEEINAVGSAKMTSLLNKWSIESSVTPSVKREPSIMSNAFSNLNIKHLFFKDSNFLGDFDADSLQRINGLRTITFLNSKLEEVPQLDLLFREMAELEAIYLEGTSMPNIMMGTNPSLPNLQLISFKGSGPFQLSQASFEWLSNSNLTYLNLQDCNIKIISDKGSVLYPVRNTLQYLDLSYTSLTEEKYIEAMLRDLSLLTHLSLAGLHLTKVPRTALEMISNSAQYLTLRGNAFRKVPEENMFFSILDFPPMPELLELDLKRCGINYIEKGAFDMLPKLQKLYLSYNNIENIHEAWYEITPVVTYIDLSWNGMVPEPESYFNIQTADGFNMLPSLKVIDLSHGVFANPDDLVASLPQSVLGISMCNINLKNSSAFSRLTASDLVILDISNNPAMEYGSLELIAFFHSLTSLKYLYARNNQIGNTLINAIEEFMKLSNAEFMIESLITLDLKGNNIKTLTSVTFKYFPNLENVDLTSNSIVSWIDSPLVYNPILKTLKISDNKIERINQVMLEDFYKLDELEIGRNPFSCECTLEKVVNQLNKTNGTLCSIPNVRILPGGNRGYFKLKSKNIRKRRDIFDHSQSLSDLIRVQRMMEINPTRQCANSIFGWQTIHPALNCVSVKDWGIDGNYYCYAEGDSLQTFKVFEETSSCVVETEKIDSSNIYDQTFIYIGMTVIVVFAALVGVIYWKWWDIRLLTRAVRNAAILAFMNNDDDEPQTTFQYSAFVSYSDKDRPWVLKELIPNLEAWNNLSICLHERDFQVGVSIMENITSCMDRSKNIVLILSQSFMRSQWCQFEMHLAQHRLIETRRDHLILILLEPIPKHKRPKTLRYLMRTKTYIQWPENPKNEDEVGHFWTRLFRALNNNNDTIKIDLIN